jgi:hypothetical protein
MSGDDPLPGPAWTPDIWISPSKLRTYANCPYRVRLEYLDKVAAPRPFNLFLAKGNIAHDLLRLNAQLIRAGKPPLAEAEMGKRAWYRLPAREFHSATARSTTSCAGSTTGRSTSTGRASSSTSRSRASGRSRCPRSGPG